jgi:diketogulonate reductase-like aldo/keto reductase
MIDIDRRELLRLLAAIAGTAALGLPGAWATDGRKETAMHSKPVPSSGEQLPVIGLGTWQTFDVGDAAGERAPLMDVLAGFVELGGRVVDSSPMYGRSEAVLGDLAAKLGLHDKLFLATKVWTSGRKAGVEQMQDSLRKLRTDTLDLMQVHNLLDVETHLATLAGWKREGRIRYVGVTHYTASAHDDVARVIERHPVDFIQINYSVGERNAEQRLLPLAQERGVAVIANRPFAGGNLFRGLRERPLPAFADEIDCASWAQILLKFVVSHPAITCAIPATSKEKHLRDNMQAGYGRMPDAEMRRRIAAAVGG